MRLNKTLTILGLVLLLVALALTTWGCSKQSDEVVNNCNYACMLSDKYSIRNGDTIFVKRDTAWIQPCLSQYWFDKEKEAALTVDGMFNHCTPFYSNGILVTHEIWTHVFNRYQITYPKLF